MKNTLVSLVAMACFGFASAQSVQAPVTTPGVLQQPRPSAAARAVDARASDAYSAHQMQSRGAKMAVCRTAAADQHLSGIELRQSLLNCMK